MMIHRPALLAGALLCALPAFADDLLSIYQQALHADPKVRSSELKAEIGQAQEAQAAGQLLPQITASANLSMIETRIQRRDDAYRGERYNISLNQSVIDLPKYFNWQRFRDIADQYHLESEDAHRNLMYEVVDRYFKTLAAEDDLYLLQREREAVAQQLEQVKKQFAKQIARITHVYEVEANLNKIEADLIDAQNKVEIQRDALRELTGEMPGVLSRLRDDLPFTPLSGDIDNSIEQAMQENPALRASQKAIDAALNNVASQQAKHLPVVDLQLSYLRTNLGFNNLTQPELDNQIAALNITVPIFNGGITSNQAREATQQLEINKMEREARQRAIIKETRDAFLSTNASHQRIAAVEKTLASAQKSREAMEKGFQYGVQTISDVLDAQAREFRAKRDLSQAKYSYVINRIRFLRAIGAIDQTLLEEANRWLITPL